MKHGRTAKVLVILAALALVAAGCGDSDDGDSADTAAPGTTEVAETNAAETTEGGEATGTTATETTGGEASGERGGTLIWGLGSNGANFFDPHMATNPFGRSWMYPFYDRLTQIDQDGAVQPMLATSWEFAEDASTLTFELRDDVVFHDGTPFDAEAAKANLDRARTQETGAGTFVDLLAVESVEVVGPTTVQLNLSTPASALPAILSDQAGMMISPAAFENPDLATMPVGSGPFVATEFRVDEVMLAEANEDYWDPELPRVDNLELRYILDPTTRLNATASGEIHGGTLDVGQFSRADAEDLGLVLTDRFSTALFQLFLNTERVPALANPAVRRAIAMAVDQEGINTALYNEECAPNDQVFGDGWYPHNPDIDSDYLPFDPEMARQILEEEGATDVEFTAITANIPSFVAQAEALQAQLAEVGVTMNVAPTPIPELISGFLVNRTADAYWTLNPGAPDPAKLVSTVWLPQSPFNPGAYEIPGILELHQQAQAATTEDERATVYHEMAQLLADEQLSIAVCTPASIMAHSADVTNVQLLSTLSDVDVSAIEVQG